MLLGFKRKLTQDVYETKKDSVSNSCSYSMSDMNEKGKKRRITPTLIYQFITDDPALTPSSQKKDPAKHDEKQARRKKSHQVCIDLSE